MTNKIDIFNMIMQKSDSEKVIILTSNYQISGFVYTCDKCNKNFYINLTNAYVCRLDDYYEGICDNGIHYNWLHVDIDKIIGFSFV